MKKLTFFVSVLCALGAAAVDYVWTGANGNLWNDGANWSPEGIPASGDTATFNTAGAEVQFGGDVTIDTINFSAATTLRSTSYGGPWPTIYSTTWNGSATVTMRGIGLRNIAGSDVTVNCPLHIPYTTTASGSTQDVWFHAYGNNVVLNGNITGDGLIVAVRKDGYNGVQLYGDNSGFEGSIRLNNEGNNNCRDKFGSATCGSANAKWTINGSAKDCGSPLFSEGTICFGEFNLPGAGQLRAPNNANITYEFGHLNTDFTMNNVNFWRSDSKGTINMRKKGSGTVSFGCWNYSNFEIVDGVVSFTSTSSANLPNDSLVFAGGVWKLGVAGTPDPSAKIKNSTADVKIDTNGNNIEFATALASSNAGGIEKLGEGKLTLAAVPGTTGAITVSGGTLALPAGFTASAIAVDTEGGATLEITTPYTDNGDYELFTYTGEGEPDLTSVSLPNTSANASKTLSYDAETGKVKLNLSAEELVWGGVAGATWTTADAWLGALSGSVKTFAAGDVVSVPENVSIELSGDVEPGAVKVAEGATLTLSGAGKITAAGGVANGGTILVEGDIEVDAAFSGAGVESVASGGSLTLAQAQALSSRVFAGTGDITLAGGAFTTEEMTTFAQFNGTVTINSGATLHPLGFLRNQKTAADFAYIMGGTHKIIMNGGTIEGFKRSANATNNEWFTNAFEMVEGTCSRINNTSARGNNDVNLFLEGPLTGKGLLTVHSRDSNGRHTTFSGDNSAFEGTLEMTGYYVANYQQLFSFSNENAGSALADWRLTTVRTGDTPVMELNHAAGTTIPFGSLTTVHHSRVLVNNANAAIQIGGTDTDSLVDADFVTNPLVLSKTGDSKLVLAAGCTVLEGSSATVAGGTLEIADDATIENLAVSIGAGGTLAGKGTVKSVEFAATGAAIAGLPDEPDTASTYDLVTCLEKPDLAAVRPVVKQTASGKGRWVAGVRENSGETKTWTIYTKFAPVGMVLVIR